MQIFVRQKYHFINTGQKGNDKPEKIFLAHKKNDNILI